MGHKESKIFEKVEDAIANQNESNSKSLEKRVLHLWKTLDIHHQGFLGPEEANVCTTPSERHLHEQEFFGKIYDYCKTTLKHEGIVFDPSLSREELIDSWKKKFDTTKSGTISYDGFCLALKAVASACNKELREKEEREVAEKLHPHGTTAQTPNKNAETAKVPETHSKSVQHLLDEEHKLLEEVQHQKEKPHKKDKKKKEEEEEVTTPNTLRRVFGHNENPILTQTFEFKFWTPKEKRSVTCNLCSKERNPQVGKQQFLFLVTNCCPQSGVPTTNYKHSCSSAHFSVHGSIFFCKFLSIIPTELPNFSFIKLGTNEQ